MKYQVKLGWPPNTLNPNSRPHWRTKSQAAKKYKQDCFYLTKQAIDPIKTSEKLHIFMDFYPPNRHERDVDNCVAMMKSGLDGVADAIQLDDKNFVIHPLIRDELGGYVMLTITDGP